MALPTFQTITSRYLYGTDSPPSDFSSESIIRPDGSSSIPIDIGDYMAGPGRFALGSRFVIVEDFFNSVLDFEVLFFAGTQLTEIRLTKQEWAEGILGLTSYGLNIDQKDYDDGAGDYVERTYIFNNTSFKLSDSVEFVIRKITNPDGTVSYEQTIENFSVIPRDDIGLDNFDFDSTDFTTAIANGALQAAIDPSGIGRRLDYNFTGSITTSTYSATDFADEKTFEASQGYSFFEASRSRIAAIHDGIETLATDLFQQGITATLVENKAVIYGTEGDDNIIGTVTPQGFDISDQGSLSVHPRKDC